MTPEQFYAQYLPYAQSVSQRTGLDPRLVLAQSALETGYGKSAPNMNFFGIKSHGRKGGSTLSTQEFEGGRMVQQPASFRGYETPEQSFTDYADFITSNPRYKGVLEADGLEAQIAAMAKSGYATDPDYGSKLASIASRFDPNSPKVIAAETMGLLGKGQQAPTTSTQGAAPMMQQEEKPRGLLGSLGIQKMEEGAEGETGQRFYQRDSFKDTAAILAQGFGRMGIMGMEEIADDIAEQRTESKARNKTLEYLRGLPNGEELVKMAEVAGPKAVAEYVLAQRFEKPDEVTPSSTIGKLQSDLARGMINKEQYEVALANMAPKGMSLEVGPDGTTRFVQGAVNSEKPLTEGQSKATGYFGKAQQAEQVLSALEKQGTGLYDSLVQNIPIAGNYLISEEYQKYSQAKRNFINSILRQESGAAIGADEFANAEQQYFPQPGEGEAIIAQKAANRRRAIEGLRVAAGEGADRIGSPKAGNVIEYDASGNRIQN